MKTEMKILDNGNYESVPCYIQHECRSEDYCWSCIQYARDMDKLILKISDGDPYELDGYENKIIVQFCPFCGHQPERLNPEAPVKGDAIVRPVDINKTTELSRND